MGEIKLNIGCGQTNFGPDWEHIDAGNYPHVKWHEVTKLRHEDYSVDEIYSSHLIAYFDREEIGSILKEWFRVLKRVGRLRIATPDWDVMRTISRPMVGPLYGKMNIPSIYHKTVYNYDELYQVLRTVGFIDIERCSEMGSDQSGATYDGKLISLNVQCIKP